MKKHNLILKAAVAMAFGAMATGSMAGTLSNTTVNFATQAFGATATAAIEVVPGATTYTFATTGGIVLNPNAIINIYYRLAGGKFTAAPTTADVSGTAVTTLGLQKTSTALSTDSTTTVVTLTNTATQNVTIGVGATVVWTPSATRAVNSVNATLNTVGGVVSVTGSASVLAANANSVALPSDVDGVAATAVNIATGASAITSTVTAGGTTAETQKIDVTATPSMTKMTTGVNSASTTVVNFGSVTFTNVAGVKGPSAAADYTVAANFGATAFGATVTGNFAAATTANAMFLSSNNSCTGALAAGSTGTLNAGKTTATFANATKAATAVPTYVCMTVDGTTVIPATTPTISATLTPSTGTDATTTATGTLYALALNGATVDVTSYIPAATVGYGQFVRIANTGTVAANISGAFIDPTTGAVGTSAVISTNLASGAAVTLTSAQIETALTAAGVVAPAATARPRLRITAPTGSLKVQSFMSNPGGVMSELDGTQN